MPSRVNSSHLPLTRFNAILQFLSLDWLAPNLNLPDPYRTQAFRLSPIWQIVIALMLNLLSLALPVMMLQVYDRIIPHQSFGTLTMLTLGVIAALILDAILRMSRAYLSGWTAASSEHSAGCAALNKFGRVDLPSFESMSAGTHLQNLGALSRLREFYGGQALTALVDLPFVVIYLVLIAYLGGKLVFAPLGLLSLFFLFSRFVGSQLRRALEDRSETDDRKINFVVSILSGIHTVKALSMEGSLRRQFEGLQKNVTISSYRVALASSRATTLGSAFGQLSLILTVTAGSLLAINGELSIGGLSACTLLAGRALQPVQRVLGIWLRFQDFTLSRAQAESLFSLPARTTNPTNPPPAFNGAITIQNLSFGYKENFPLFHSLNIEVNPGEIIAITGSKGSGKSTLLQLIAGVLTPQQGKILVDHLEPSHFGMSELRSHIGYLPQQSTIFKGTILENLTGFQSDEEVVSITKKTGTRLGLDAIVDLLPRGYQTMLSDSPADPVPPGIKQRISLVRVLRHMPSVLLFDDADHSLDKVGYNLLFKLLGTLKGQCTILMVSQDQNLLSFADRTFQLETGGLSQMGIPGIPHFSPLFELTREVAR